MKINELLNINSIYTKEEKKIILSFLLNCKNNDLYLIDVVPEKIVKKYKKLLKKDNVVQYLINNANFLGYDFYVDKNVLIPRFETEELVSYTNELIEKYLDKENINILDLGTGSGVIAICLNLYDEKRKVTAVDISKRALKVAKKNANKYNLDIKFIKSNMLNKVTGKFDVIISNPPYIYEDDTNIEEKVLKYEPHLALFGGLKYYEEILKNAKNYLNEKSIIAFEIGYNQKQDINELIKKYFKDSKIINKQDLNGFDRYIYILNNFE